MFAGHEVRNSKIYILKKKLNLDNTGYSYLNETSCYRRSSATPDGDVSNGKLYRISKKTGKGGRKTMLDVGNSWEMRYLPAVPREHAYPRNRTKILLT